MVGFNAGDAERKINAPKAIHKRQSPCPQARSLQSMAGTVVGRRKPTYQSPRSPIRALKERSRGNAQPDHSAIECRGREPPSADLHIRELRREQISAGMPADLKESTRTTSEADITRYLIPTFGKRRVETITRERMQSFLEELSSRLSSSVVGHLRWHLNAIFRMAQSATA